MRKGDAGIPLLSAAFPDRRMLLASLEECRGPAGEIAISTRANPPHGEPVVVEVSCPGLPNRLYLRGRAQDRDNRDRLLIRLSGDQRTKCEFLVSFGIGTLGPIARRHGQRYFAYLPVLWRPFGETDMRIGVADNLSLRGALMYTTEDIERGNLIVLRLRAHAVGELVLTGRVLACERTASYRNSVRLKFAQQSSGQLRDLRRALRAFRERGRVLSVKSAFE